MIWNSKCRRVWCPAFYGRFSSSHGAKFVQFVVDLLRITLPPFTSRFALSSRASWKLALRVEYKKKPPRGRKHVLRAISTCVFHDQTRYNYFIVDLRFCVHQQHIIIITKKSRLAAWCIKRSSARRRRRLADAKSPQNLFSFMGSPYKAVARFRHSGEKQNSCSIAFLTLVSSGCCD